MPKRAKRLGLTRFQPATPPSEPTSSRDEEGTRLGRVAALWGIAGALLLLTQAILRLSPRALAPLVDGALRPWQLAVYVGWVGFNAYAEGYRGFQKGFAPRVVARAVDLARAARPRALDVLLAPLYCMGFFHAPRRRVLTSWSLLAGIVILVLLAHRTPDPYRGIIDGGVVVGLAWGALVTAVLAVRALLVRAPAVSRPSPSP